MRTAIVVIGAGYGDEGKGKTVDHFCESFSPETTLVTRYSGGSQASHTVVRNGIRHAYSHFGSGTTYGCSTYLDENFILNPIVFRHEWEELQQLGINPTVYANYKCKITTIFDMLMNHIDEYDRGNNRHGSCGLGINRTINRHEDIKFTMNMIHDKSVLKRIQEYYPKVKLPNDYILEKFQDDLMFMFNNLMFDDNSIYKNYQHVIFEGSQGLQLEEDSGNFPHVTRGYVGIRNIIKDLKSFDECNINYVHRIYQTKHGAGPFDHEMDLKPFFSIIDQTNIPNEFQGSLRFAPIDLDKMFNTINRDIMHHIYHNYNVKFNYNLCITCMDQIRNSEFVPYILNNKFCIGDDKEITDILFNKCKDNGLNLIFLTGV